MTKMAAKAAFLSILSIAMALLVSCGAVKELVGGAPEFSDPDFNRTPPPVLMPETPGENAVHNEDETGAGSIDMSRVADGYVAVTCSAETVAKFRVEKDDYVYDYDLKNNGETEFFPLAAGDGHYAFTIFLNKSGDEYFYFLNGEADVALVSEQTPFLYPNKIIRYTPESNAVSFSYEIAAHASTDLEVIQQVYYWIKDNVTYDEDKVSFVKENTDYLPDVDEVLQNEKGICYDYAALAATMLRANNIPCKLIMGYANAGDGSQIIHAWNLIWTEEEGWIAVKVEANKNTWEFVDLTFAASGDAEIQELIKDQNNYAEMYIH